MKGLKRVAASGAPEEQIPALVDRVGVVGAARKLGVAPSTVSRWLKANGFRKVTRWQKVSYGG